MSQKSEIEWTEHTWNPIVGCSIVSPGCTNCYAMRMAARIEATGNAPHYTGLTKKVNGNAVWTGKLALAPEATLTEPLRRKKPTMYFVNSMGDLFHEDCPDEWIDRVFAVMALCPQHTFQVLTKRAERMRSYLADEIPRLGGIARTHEIDEAMDILCHQYEPGPTDADWPLANVWLGVSCEHQEEADERIPLLLQTPAAVRFISAEPLLGPIDLLAVAAPEKVEGEDWRFSALETGDIYYRRIENEFDDRVMWDSGDGPYRDHALDWAIVGGESGPYARPMHPQWARDIRDQCQAVGVAFFFKQWGEFEPLGERPSIKYWCGVLNPKWTEIDGFAMYRVGKKAAGRILDGREWNEFPNAAKAVEAA